MLLLCFDLCVNCCVSCVCGVRFLVCMCLTLSVIFYYGVLVGYYVVFILVWFVLCFVAVVDVIVASGYFL